MKKIIFIALALFTTMSCEDLTELNRDLKNPEEVPPGALFASATKSLFDFMTSPNVNVNNFRLWAQQWAQTTYADESNYELVERNVNGAAWNTLYAEVIRDLRDAKDFIQEDQFLSADAKAAQTAMAEVLEVFAYHALVDIFGDIPYTEAFGDDVTPAYDDDAAIYADLVTRLNAAIGNLEGDSEMGSFDLVYGGNTEQWKRFANSLKLRMAIRLADVNPGLSETMAEEAATGVLRGNADNFALNYQSSTPNTNPLWVNLVQSGRSDYVASSTIVDPMVALDDPRLPFYFMDTFGAPAEFVGGAYGDNNAYNTFSHPGELQKDPTFPGIIMSYWEVAFLLADAAERGYDVGGGTAEDFYNAGIEASILYWGGDQDDVDDYLANPDVAYGTAIGNTPFERIAFQKWISLYDQGFEAWSTVRFYDYPPMELAVLSDLPTPSRYTYPVTEYSLNEENVATARSNMGGDELQGRVFWDVN